MIQERQQVLCGQVDANVKPLVMNRDDTITMLSQASALALQLKQVITCGSPSALLSQASIINSRMLSVEAGRERAMNSDEKTSGGEIRVKKNEGVNDLKLRIDSFGVIGTALSPPKFEESKKDGASLSLTWSLSPPQPKHSSLQMELQHAEGKDGKFVTVYQGKNSHFTMKQMSPGPHTFRARAANEFGWSDFSDEFVCIISNGRFISC